MSESGMAFTCEIKSATPVAPPSIKLLGNRKLSRPKAADNIPMLIIRMSFINPYPTTFNSLKPKASSYREYSLSLPLFSFLWRSIPYN